MDGNRYPRNAPRYEDERWPTNNPELLVIPESNRYYMAYNYIGQTHTVAGPVAKVYQAVNSSGMPIFVDIGIGALPSDWFTLVIWAEDLDADLERMLNAVDHGNAWLEVTGYIYLYEGQLQIQTGHGYIEYQWWTGVR